MRSPEGEAGGVPSTLSSIRLRSRSFNRSFSRSRRRTSRACRSASRSRSRVSLLLTEMPKRLESIPWRPRRLEESVREEPWVVVELSPFGGAGGAARSLVEALPIAGYTKLELIMTNNKKDAEIRSVCEAAVGVVECVIGMCGSRSVRGVGLVAVVGVVRWRGSGGWFGFRVVIWCVWCGACLEVELWSLRERQAIAKLHRVAFGWRTAYRSPSAAKPPPGGYLSRFRNNGRVRTHINARN